jgi:hypothetical protein
MKIENYEKARDLVTEIAMLKEVYEGDRFNFKKALWLIGGFEDTESKNLIDIVEKWCREEFQPHWEAIIDSRLKQLEKL